jgi:hypothetical protein
VGLSSETLRSLVTLVEVGHRRRLKRRTPCLSCSLGERKLINQFVVINYLPRGRHSCDVSKSGMRETWSLAFSRTTSGESAEGRSTG